MATLYLDRKNLMVKLDGRALALYENGEKRGTVPLAQLGRVVVRGNISLESRLLCAMGEHKVDVVFLGGRNGRKGSMAFGHSHNDARRRLAQYHLYFDRSWQLAMARDLVIAKCDKQRQLLRQAMEIRPDLRHALSKADRSLAEMAQSLSALDMEQASIMQFRGLEGGAAAVYFSAYKTLFAGSLQFTRRLRRPPPDPVNACLSLGNTLLHFEAVAVCHQVGLDPLLGFYHEPAWGRESLACDLMEPVRPRLDHLVWRLFGDKVLRAEHFSSEQGRCQMNKAGRKHFYAHYEQFAYPVRRLLRLKAFQLSRELLHKAPELW